MMESDTTTTQSAAVADESATTMNGQATTINGVSHSAHALTGHPIEIACADTVGAEMACADRATPDENNISSVDETAAEPVEVSMLTEKTAPANGRSDNGRANSRPAYAQSPTALQDMFLNGLRRENIDVVLYFTDGSQERGAVRAFDTFTILLENRSSGKAQLVYKHAVVRIFPTRTPSQLPLGDRSRKA